MYCCQVKCSSIRLPRLAIEHWCSLRTSCQAQPARLRAVFEYFSARPSTEDDGGSHLGSGRCRRKVPLVDTIYPIDTNPHRGPVPLVTKVTTITLAILGQWRYSEWWVVKLVKHEICEQAAFGTRKRTRPSLLRLGYCALSHSGWNRTLSAHMLFGCQIQNCPPNIFERCRDFRFFFNGAKTLAQLTMFIGMAVIVCYI